MQCITGTDTVPVLKVRCSDLQNSLRTSEAEEAPPADLRCQNPLEKAVSETPGHCRFLPVPGTVWAAALAAVYNAGASPVAGRGAAVAVPVVAELGGQVVLVDDPASVCADMYRPTGGYIGYTLRLPP